MSDHTGIISGMKYRVPPYGTVLRRVFSTETVMILGREPGSFMYSLAIALVVPDEFEHVQPGDLFPAFPYLANDWDVVED